MYINIFIYNVFITNTILFFKKLFIYLNSFLRQRQFSAPSLHTGYQLSYRTDGVNPPWRADGWSCTFPAQACDACSQLGLTLFNLGWQEGQLALCPWHKYLVSVVITDNPDSQGFRVCSMVQTWNLILLGFPYGNMCVRKGQAGSQPARYIYYRSWAGRFYVIHGGMWS